MGDQERHADLGAAIQQGVVERELKTGLSLRSTGVVGRGKERLQQVFCG